MEKTGDLLITFPTSALKEIARIVLLEDQRIKFSFTTDDTRWPPDRRFRLLRFRCATDRNAAYKVLRKFRF